MTDLELVAVVYLTVAIAVVAWGLVRELRDHGEGKRW